MAQAQSFPGANDDGSGTVSVIEIAQALAGRAYIRSGASLFMTFFGEEEGSLGVALLHAAIRCFRWPQTVADLNLEQVGRTDSSAGPRDLERHADRVPDIPTIAHAAAGG